MKVYTFEAFPQNWALTQNNIANAYCDRIKGEQASNLELAIAYYEKPLVLKVYTIDSFPYEWAQTQE